MYIIRLARALNCEGPRIGARVIFEYISGSSPQKVLCTSLAFHGLFQQFISPKFA